MASKLADMEAYLRSNPDIMLPSGRVIKAAELAMVRIYQHQTRDEKTVSETLHHNNIGFASCDAKWGSYIARWVMSGKNVSERHQPRMMKLAVKYRRQLVELAEARKMKAGEGDDKVES